MNREDYEEFMQDSFRRRLELARRKGADYATENIISNFKRMAKVIETLRVDPTKPHGVALIYALLKIDRLCNLLSKNTRPRNESLQDTVDDLKNYIDLLEACLIEEGIL